MPSVSHLGFLLMRNSKINDFLWLQQHHCTSTTDNVTGLWHYTGTARMSAPCTATVYSVARGTHKILASAYSKVSINFVL